MPDTPPATPVRDLLQAPCSVPNCPNPGVLTGTSVTDPPMFCVQHRTEWRDHNRGMS